MLNFKTNKLVTHDLERFNSETKYKKIKESKQIKAKHRTKELACFTLAICMIACAILFDFTAIAQGQGQGRDLTEAPHVIKAGEKELAVVGSSSQAEAVIDDIVAYYGGGNEVAKAYVNPALKVDVKKMAIGEVNPVILDKDQAVAKILHMNSSENPIFTVTVNSSLFRKERIEFDSKKVKTKKLYEGKTQIARKGREGVRLITGSGTFVNGELVDSMVYKNQVIQEPVTQVIKVGTKKRIIKGTATGDFIWPISSSHHITSGYGGRVGPFFGNEFHMGYDIAGSYGASILAADGGTVVKASFHPSYGNEVVIDHGNGLQTRYAHNSSLNVKVGQKVSRGEVIAFCGSTGDSIGNHLHFEVLKNGTHTNPAPYL